MFPDLAVGKACVNCHNEHKESPKKDWKLNDIMGATTWSVNKDSFTTSEMFLYVKTYLNASLKTYNKYLEKVNLFNNTKKPIIGDKWPIEGYYLPTKDVFKNKLDSLYAINFLNAILEKQ